MMKKYRYNLSKKEKMLFHGTSHKNLEKINAGGLNRSYAGMNGKTFAPTFQRYITNITRILARILKLGFCCTERTTCRFEMIRDDGFEYNSQKKL